MVKMGATIRFKYLWSTVFPSFDVWCVASGSHDYFGCQWKKAHLIPVAFTAWTITASCATCDRHAILFIFHVKPFISGSFSLTSVGKHFIYGVVVFRMNTFNVMLFLVGPIKIIIPGLQIPQLKIRPIFIYNNKTSAAAIGIADLFNTTFSLLIEFTFCLLLRGRGPLESTFLARHLLPFDVLYFAYTSKNSLPTKIVLKTKYQNNF